MQDLDTWWVADGISPVFISAHRAIIYCYHNGKWGLSTHTETASKNTIQLTLGCYQSLSILLTPTNWLDVRTVSITLTKTGLCVYTQQYSMSRVWMWNATYARSTWRPPTTPILKADEPFGYTGRRRLTGVNWAIGGDPYFGLSAHSLLNEHTAKQPLQLPLLQLESVHHHAFPPPQTLGQNHPSFFFFTLLLRR